MEKIGIDVHNSPPSGVKRDGGAGLVPPMLGKALNGGGAMLLLHTKDIMRRPYVEREVKFRPQS